MDGATLLFEGPIGRMRAEDVLTCASQIPGRVRVTFETEDRATGAPRAVDLTLDEGRLVGLGPRGKGLRLGDLAVARGVIARAELEAMLVAPGGPVGERLTAGGRLAPEHLEDLLWERHARVVWSLLSWDRGRFVVAAPGEPPCEGEVEVSPPVAVAGILLDGLQRAESANAPRDEDTLSSD